MTRHFLKGFSLLFLITYMSCGNSTQQSDNKAFINWAKEHAHEIKTFDTEAESEDFVPLKAIVKDARIVALGESRHDIREQFLLKHRMVKYLVEELGFTLFLLEGSLPYAHHLNAYLLEGKGNLNDLMAQMPGWFIWDTEELKTTFQWMRAYNEKAENTAKIQFHGFDITAPNEGLDSIFRYLQQVDPSAYQHFQKLYFAQDQIHDDFWPATLDRYANMYPGRKDTLRVNYEHLYNHLYDHPEAYISQTSESEYRKILRFAYSAREANRMFASESRLAMGLTRDQAMAAHISYLLDSLAPQQKAMIWAHNVHIAASTFTMTGEEGTIKGMGAILKEKYQDDYIALGASFNRGTLQHQQRDLPPAPPHTVDGAFAQVGKSAFLIDLQLLSGNHPAAVWANQNQVLQGQEFEMMCVPQDAFDAFFFIDNISQVILSPISAQRLRDMRP